MIVVFCRFTGADADAEPEVADAFAFVEPGRDCRGLAGVDGFRGVVAAGVGFWPFACSSSTSSLSKTRAISLFFSAGSLSAGVASTSPFDDCKTHVVSILSGLVWAKEVLTEPFRAAGLGLGGIGAG
jgi:hypothetical protein